MPLTLPAPPERAPNPNNAQTFAEDMSAALAWERDLFEVMRLAQVMTAADKTQSATDTTAGRLLKVGDFGMGKGVHLTGATAIKDRNLAPGTYYYTASSVPGGPESLSYYHSLIVTREEVSGLTAFLDCRLSTGQPAVWSGYTDGTTMTWRRLDPERGSNANGEYVRFSDGTQICWRTFSVGPVNTAHGSQYISAATTWNFPAAFVGGVTPHVGGVDTNLGGATTISGYSALPGSCSVTAKRLSSSATACTVSAVASGRWY